MKRLALASAALALAVLFSAPSFAADAASGPVTCSDGTTSPHGGRGACSKHGGIKKDDASAPAAAAPAAPAKAAKASDTAASGPVTCADGTSSKKAGRGACSKHGGIKKDEAAAPAAAKAAAPTAAPAAAPAPAAAAAPAKAASAAGSGGSVNSDATGATAKCKDGSFSHSKTHSGTCSKHGGVAEWLDGSSKQ